MYNYNKRRKKMEKVTRMLTADDVSEILRVSRSTAYKEIRELKKDLKSKGYRVSVGARVPEEFVLERYGLKGIGDER